MTINYIGLPTVAKFQKDSSITFAVRKEDPILIRIDEELAAYHKADHDGDYYGRRLSLVELFFLCNYWVRGLDQHRIEMRKERYPAVIGLFEAVVRQLGILLGASNEKQVARIVEEMYGRALSKHGVIMDESIRKADYFDRLQREIYRIRFRGGLALQYCWWFEKTPSQLVPAQSQYAYNPKLTRMGQHSFENWGAFVMTLERDLYMAYHFTPDPHEKNKKGIYHSAYIGSQPVLMAGTMKIDNGVIRGIRNDSGHYLPTMANMTGCLQALRMHAVNLTEIEIYDHDGNYVGLGEDFLRSGMSWDTFVAHRAKEWDHRREADEMRVRRDIGVRYMHKAGPPPLPPRTQRVS